jgi:hypothetical protein
VTLFQVIALFLFINLNRQVRQERQVFSWFFNLKHFLCVLGVLGG